MNKTAKQRRLYGELFHALSARMLVIGNKIQAVEDVQITLHWEDPLPEDDLLEAQSAQIWSGLGVSEDTLQRNAGWNPDIERMKMQAQAQQKLALAPMLPQPPATQPNGIPAESPQQATPGQPTTREGQ